MSTLPAHHSSMTTYKYLYSVIAALICLVSACSKHTPTEYVFHLPPDFPPPPVPVDNPMTLEKVSLGRHLFYDTRLSANNTQSCSSCHLQAQAFSESLATGVGSTGEVLARNSLSLTNVAYNETFTWAHDSLTSIEAQILIPLFNEAPIEMGLTGNEEAILARLQKDATYQKLFAAAFPEQNKNITLDQTVKALASFIRSLTSFNSPFDRYAYYGEDDALTDSQLRGLGIFMSEKTECRHCHGGFNFSQSTNQHGLAITERPFHNTGLYNPEVPPANFDQGLYDISLREEDKGKFRAPTLRNLQYSAPYMHDGSLATLVEVIDFYAQGGQNLSSGPLKGDGRAHPQKSDLIKAFPLSEEEKQDLIHFLHALNDESFIENPLYSNPWKTQP
ncbi:Cytochrome c551 peroxidase [Thalassocella blandensis]|nr:Cytochrome c551 peroxidase [Thalassocella blandensis]